MIYISYDRSIYIIYISNIICISYNRSEMRSIVIDRDRRLWCGTRALRIYQVRVPFFCFSFSLVWYPHFACLPDTNSLVFNKKIVCGAVSALRIYQARISFFVLFFVFVRYPRCAYLVGGRAEVDADLPIKNVLFFIFLLVFKKLIVPGGCTEVAADLPR